MLLVRDGVKRHLDISFYNIPEWNTGTGEKAGKVISTKVYATNDAIFS
jgi:hypothetical protein